MAENVRVVVRCRPMNRKELDMKCKPIVQIKDCAVSLENPTDRTAPAKTFTYDNAYDSNGPTEALYNDICYSLIENVLEGYNGTIFAYGQTGCGKSHTMQGPDVSDPSVLAPSQRGIISRSFDHIFEAISVSASVRYLALVSYLEIYNENIRDLLNPSSNPTNHQLKELPGEGVIVQGLSAHAVHNARECDELLRDGSKNRIVGATLMNAGSSRSHSIFTISLEQIDTETVDGDRDDNGSGTPATTGIRKGKLNLVDLAGSERQNKTGATGDRLKEATKINLSLSALGNVISALVDGKTKHIPYRDSKLTRLLQDSLGGNTKTLMIACISPADYNYDETLSTLRYASRAKNIHNKPIINEDPKDTMLREFQQEIVELRKLLESSSVGERTSAISFPEDRESWLELERAKLRAEYETETGRLKSEHRAQQEEKDDLVRSMERLKTHYERQLKNLAGNDDTNNNNVTRPAANGIVIVQQEARNRIEVIKNALIGGERANDVQLKERRHKRKIAAQRRLSALAQALSRVEESSDRDLLQEHYSDFQHELAVKTDALKLCRQRVKALDREVADLQSEFQFDRADYLETIRRLERNLKFYQQIFEKALPILRKDGKYWDPDVIQQESAWIDDSKKWKLPEESMNRFRLPPAASAPSKRSGRNQAAKNDAPPDSTNEMSDDATPAKPQNIAELYFRPRRAVELMHQRKGFNSWKDFATRNRRQQSGNLSCTWFAPNSNLPPTPAGTPPPPFSSIVNSAIRTQTTAAPPQPPPPPPPTFSKTWSGLTDELIANGGGNGLNFTQKFLTNGNHMDDKFQISCELTDLMGPPTIRLKSTDRLILMGQQRRPRHLKALQHNRRANT